MQRPNPTLSPDFSEISITLFLDSHSGGWRAVNMVRHLMEGSFLRCMIAVLMAVQLAGCGGGGSNSDSPGSSAATASSSDSSHSSAVAISSATVKWVAPTTRADGASISLANIDGYRVYYGTAEGNYTNRIDVTDSSVEGVVVRDLPAGTNYFVVTTYDTDGRESAYSGVVIKTI